MSDMIDPDRKPHPAREAAHRTKGCLAVIVALAVLLGGGWFIADRVGGFMEDFGQVPDYEGEGKDDVVVTIPEGSALGEIGTILVEEDVVKSEKAFTEAVNKEPDATGIQAGSYQMKTQLPAARALEILLDPESQVRDRVTVREGLRLSLQLEALQDGTDFKVADYEKALASPGDLGLPSYAKNEPEGFLFPDTYEVTPESTPGSILKNMVAQYNSVAKDVGLEARAESLGLSPYETVVVASIIEAEVNQPEYRPMVARVILNRLDEGQKLQMDSTVHYAVGKNGGVTTTDKDRADPSPYNTYKHEGLPPGPINGPGKAALEAAVNPSKGDWLYFVTVNLDSGETKFTDDPAEHEKNVQEFQQWCQANQGRC